MADKPADSKRKMTQAILEDEKDKKQVFEFLDDDDEYEEFEDKGNFYKLIN